MSWQEELKQLDDALTTGRISPDDYRQRHDQLLAQASGQPQDRSDLAAEPPSSAPPQETEVMEPAAPQETELMHPAAPPETEVMSPASPQETEVMSPAGKSEATQIVRPDGDSRTKLVPPVSAGRLGEATTKVVRPVAPPPGASARPGGANRSSDDRPPWAADELPPGFGSPNWSRQGPDSFDEPIGKSGKGRIIVLALVIVVILLGVAGLIYLAATRSATSTQPQPSTSASARPATTSATTQQPAATGSTLPQGPFASVPGTPQSGDSSNTSSDNSVTNQLPGGP